VRVLDLFCKAGGSAMGLHMAFPDAEIVGVDIEPQKHYPFTFVQYDALKFPPTGFDFIWASPPCQAHSRLQINGIKYESLIDAVRWHLSKRAWKTPRVIENVVGAPLVNPITLCGSMFGLGVWRHRIFESTFEIEQPICRHELIPEPLDVTGTGGPCNHRKTKGGGLHRKPKSMAQASAAMGIDWMTRRELTQAIPPAYSEYIGRQWAALRRAGGEMSTLPKIDMRGKNATVSMMELRSQPGEVFLLVQKGLSVRVEKNGKHVGTIIPPDAEGEETVVHRNGRIEGSMPLTFRASLGSGGYGK
jgi:DNA (cytosine-5)-methyltransferase 1